MSLALINSASLNVAQFPSYTGCIFYFIPVSQKIVDLEKALMTNGPFS